MLPAVVLTGGLGTRLREVTGAAVPKVLVPVGGRPFIDYKLAGLAAEGVEEAVLLVGTLAEQVEAHVGDGTQLGLRVRYVQDGPRLLGTGGAIAAALPELPEAFWVTYGDTFLQLDLAAAERAFTDSGCTALMTVLHNRDRWEPSNVRVDAGRVVSYAKGAPPGTHEHIDYGIVAIGQEAFAGRRPGDVFDLGEVFRALAERRDLAAFEVTEPFHDVGTVEALRATEAYFAADDTWARITASR